MAVLIKILSAKFEYKGVRGAVEWDAEAGLYRSAIKHDGAVITCQAHEIQGLLKGFRESLRDYLRAAEAESILTETVAPDDSAVQF